MNEKICLVFNLKFYAKGKTPHFFGLLSLTFIDTMQFNPTELFYKLHQIVFADSTYREFHHLVPSVGCDVLE